MMMSRVEVAKKEQKTCARTDHTSSGSKERTTVTATLLFFNTPPVAEGKARRGQPKEEQKGVAAK